VHIKTGQPSQRNRWRRANPRRLEHRRWAEDCEILVLEELPIPEMEAMHGSERIAAAIAARQPGRG
jgi:hypothetical protein